MGTDLIPHQIHRFSFRPLGMDQVTNILSDF
jgi:hypothetical protein